MNRRAFLLATGASALVSAPAEARVPFALHSSPIDLLSPPFQDDRGQMSQLSDFAGRVVLLNVWASWCPPCVDEMPALDRLQAAIGGADFTVLPLCIDKDGLAAARRFYKRNGIQSLNLFWAEQLRIQMAFAVVGLPSSLLIDRRGKELARLSGPALWDGPEAVQQLRRVLTL